MILERIVLLKLNENKDEYSRQHQIPKNMRSEVSRKIGSEFDKSNGMTSRDLIRGLSATQERIYLPKLIGISANHQEFADRAKDYWSDFTIIPTVKGLRLNIATNSQEIDGETVEVPVNLDDYMVYKFAMSSSKVAKTPEELDNLSFYDFYLEDLSEVKAKQEKDFDAKKRAAISFARIASKFEDNETKINWLLELTKEEGVFFDEAMPRVDKEMQLYDLADKRPVLFNAYLDDKNIEHKALLTKAITYLVVVKEGNDYFYDSENLGSETAAISWLTNPVKSAQVAAMKSRLEQLASNAKKSLNLIK